jgi:glycosyltransferase involved in cell wall biosynthesis
MSAVRPQIVAIIPAHNEAPRIATVIQSVLVSGAVARVVVVDDGSTDGTGQIAQQAGAYLVSLPSNVGKGQAMLAGVRATIEPIVVFLRANLLGLTPGHISRLVTPVLEGTCVLTTGLLDVGPILDEIWESMPRIGVERAVQRSVLNQVPASFWYDFRIEVCINAIAEKMGKTCDVKMYGACRYHDGQTAQGLLRVVRGGREVLLAMGEASQL